MNTANELSSARGNFIELGVVLKQVKQTHIDSSLATLGSLLGLMSIIVAIYYIATINSEPSFLIIALQNIAIIFVFLCIVVGTVMVTIHLGGERWLFIHENGIRLLKRGKETKIPYSQLQHFRFKKTRVYKESYQGEFFLGTTFKLEIRSNAGRSIKWLGFNSSGKGYKVGFDSGSVTDSIDYDWLIHHLSPTVASSMTARVEMGEKVLWGRAAFIKRTGLEIKKKASLFSSEMIFVPWSDLVDLQFSDGQLSLAVGKPSLSESWTAKINCDEVNVLPGYLMIQRLLKSRTADAEMSHQSRDDISIAVASEHIVPYMTPMP